MIWYAIHLAHPETLRYLAEQHRLIRDWAPQNAPCKVAFVAEKKVLMIADFTEVKEWSVPKTDVAQGYAWCFANQQRLEVELECADYSKLLRVDNTSLLPMLNAWAQKELDEYVLRFGDFVADTPVLDVADVEDVPVTEVAFALPSGDYEQMSIFDLELA